MTTKLAVNQMALITTMVLGGAVVPRAFYSDETKSSLRPEIKMQKKAQFFGEFPIITHVKPVVVNSIAEMTQNKSF